MKYEFDYDSMNSLYNEPMIGKISIEDDNIIFQFYDSTNGQIIGYVYCKGIIAIKACFANQNEELLPCMVYEVRWTEFSQNQISDVLYDMQYSYKYSSGELCIPENETYFGFFVFGGPIDLSIICNAVIISK